MVQPMGTKNSTSAPSDRLTITLGEDQRRQVAAMARQRRTSEASIIRWAVDEYLAAHRVGSSGDRHEGIEK